MDAMRSVQIGSLLLLACGGGSVHHLADGNPDTPAMADAAPPDAPPVGAVSVKVTSQGAPSASVPVYFQNDDSTLVMEAMTDASGTATAMMRAGFVTVLEPQAVVTGVGPSVMITPSGQRLATFAGVKPGDMLHDDLDVLTTEVDTGVTVTIDPDPNPAATSYTVHTTCSDGSVFISQGSGSGTGTLPTVSATLANCSGTADIVVISSSVNGVLLDSFSWPASRSRWAAT